MSFNYGAYTALDWFFQALAFAALAIEAWAFIDAVRHPAPAYVAASKRTKPLWLAILAVALVIGIAGVAYHIGVIGILPIAAFVAAAVYLTDVRPKVSQFRGGNQTHQGPYGPW